MESFAPDVLFNLVDQFKNNRSFDQNIVSLFEMQGVPFTGCGATGLVCASTRESRKRFSVIITFMFPTLWSFRGGQRIARLKRPTFPLLVKPVKEEASYGISQASFVKTDEEFREARGFHSREA